MWEPYDDYEAYTRHQDTTYERLIEGKTHETCSYAEGCIYGKEPPESCAVETKDLFCNKYDTWVPRDELVQGVCDCYTED